MPGGDGSGPDGMGPMTGRAAGFCAGHGVPGYASPLPGGGGRGMRLGRGPGRGRRGGFGRGWFGFGGYRGYGWPQPPAGQDPGAEADRLEARADSLRRVLGDIEERLAELRSDDDGER